MCLGALTDPVGPDFTKINPTQKVVLIFWQPQIDNIRTEISLYEAEIMETLDLLEKFLNDLKH